MADLRRRVGRIITDTQGQTGAVAVTVYKAGTLTKATLAANKAGTEALANPFNSDAYGMWSFFVDVETLTSSDYELDIVFSKDGYDFSVVNERFENHSMVGGLFSSTGVQKADFDAGTFLYATLDDTPEAKTSAEVMGLLTAAAPNQLVDHTAVTFSAGNGLSGGGTLAANRSFAVGPGTGIVVSATTVGVTGVLEDLFALTAPASDGQFIVATGVGVFAYESGATVRTSLGLAIGVNVLAQQTIGILDDNLLEVDGSPNVGEIARFTANGIEGLTYAETMAALSGQASADFSMGSNKITLLTDPTAAQDAATKAYVDATAQGLKVHTAVACATTANISLTGEQTLDGILTSTDRVLVRSQTAPEENGIYVSAGGAWARAADMNASDEVAGSFVFVSGGTTLGHTGWACTVEPDGFIIGTTAMPWSQFSDAGYITVSTGLVQTGNNIAVDGVLEDLDTVGPVTGDNYFLVGTAAGVLAWETPSGARTSMGVAIGSDVQQFNANLAAIAGLTFADDKMIIGTGAGTIGMIDCTAFAQTILDDADGAAVIATIGAAASGVNTDITGLTGLATQNAIQISPFDVGAGQTGEIRFLELAGGGTNYVGLKAPDALAGNIVFTLPVNIEDGKVLQTDASGNFSWASLAGGGDMLADGSVPFDGAVSIGVDGTGVDLTFFGATASYKTWWDANGDTNGAWYFGADTKGIMVTWYGDTTGHTIVFDPSGDTNGSLLIGADTKGILFSLFGDVTGCGVFWDPSTDTNGTLAIGASGGSKGVDLIAYGATNLSLMHWDQSLNALKLEGATLFIKEQAEAQASVAAYGQLWVDTATPNALYFTDDADTDFWLNRTAGIANTNMVVVDDADAAEHDYMKLTTTGVVGREYAEVLTDIFSVNMPENVTIRLDPILSADTKWTGITRDVVAGTTGLVYGYCYYMAATGKWELTNATAIATSHGEVGMCVIAAASDATGTLLMNGMIRADDEFPTFTAGSDIFLSAATAGLLTETAPTGTTDFVVRIVAAAPTADSISFKGGHAYATLV